MIGILLAAALGTPQPILCDAKKDGSRVEILNCNGDVTTLRPIKIRPPKPAPKPIPK